MLLRLAAKHGKVIEVQIIKIGSAHQKCARNLLAKTRLCWQRTKQVSHATSRHSRNVALVASTESRIVFGDAVAVVTGQRLVAAFTGQHHLHMFGRQIRDKIQCDTGRVRQRLILVPNQPWQFRKKLLGRHNNFAMLGFVCVRHHPRIYKLVRFALCECNGKCANRLFHQRCHRRRDRSRVNAARQEHTKWYVTHESKPHRFGESFAILVDHGPLGVRTRRRRRNVVAITNIPVFAKCELSALPDQCVPSRQSSDAGKQGFLTRRCMIGQKVWQRGAIQLGTHAPHCQQRFDLRTKDQTSICLMQVIERLDTIPITRQKQLALG